MKKQSQTSDCFANKGTYCSALIEMMCKTGKCSFYKTRKQYLEDLKKYPPIDYKKPLGVRK